MIKKILITIAILCFFISSINAVSAADVISVSDPEDDVSYEDLDTSYEDELPLVSRPNVDIVEVSCTQDGAELTIELKLKEGGVVQNTGTVSMTNIEGFIYGIDLLTTSSEYLISYGINETSGEVDCTIEVDEIGKNTVNIDYDECSGGTSNVLTVKFDLLTSSEKIIQVIGLATEIRTVLLSLEDIDYAMYMDYAPSEETLVDYEPKTESYYSAELGQTISFTADSLAYYTYDSVDPVEVSNSELDDYTWFWTFEGDPTVLTGRTATRSFSIQGNYSGTLYVRDSNGNYGVDFFYAEITGSVEDDDTNGEEETPLMTFVILMGIIIIAGVAVAVYFLKK